MASVEELKKDLEELRSLYEKANRSKVRDMLSIDIRKVETEIIHKTEQQGDQQITADSQPGKPSSSGDAPIKTTVPQSRFTVDIKTYAWDQSEKFMKIYATIEGVESLPKENITCDFTNRSFKLYVKDLKNKDFRVYVTNLMEEILVKESYFKVKTNTVLVMLKKKETGKTWAFVTEREKKAKDSSDKKPKYDDNKDPSDGLMDLMKQMYDEGDDEMKKTIQKAWCESREKQDAKV